MIVSRGSHCSCSKFQDNCSREPGFFLAKSDDASTKRKLPSLQMALMFPRSAAIHDAFERVSAVGAGRMME